MRHTSISYILFAGSTLCRPGLAIWKQPERAKESLGIPRDDHPTILRIRTQLLPPSLSRFHSHISFFITLHVLIRINVLLKIQHVDLYNAYLLLFLIKILLSSGIHTPRYALSM